MGGDWFDVIPLSGMRVAMVVGDVVGHGIQASATMGRLRTAVRTLADIDLAPDELLTHLDDLVLHLSEARRAATPGPAGGRRDLPVRGVRPGVAALHAVPGGTSAARGDPAGRDGSAPRTALGAAAGAGRAAVRSAEFELADDSVLAFYTDGLVTSRGRDVDQGEALLREALSGAAGPLDETCDRVLNSVLAPGGATDDVALLLARLRGLPSSQVTTWDIPADPALVAPIRKQVLDQLAAWSLTDASFTAELVVSELVTNAIRYGARRSGSA
ncbi:SpoIIE family protein phosphatase OS=Streptomyces tendae OX=1932 GN=F3L20_16690 PE=4 SV=1 [Streptomyces tendae]